MITPELNKIYQGDTLEVLKNWPDEFVDLVITSPPYFALRNYGVEGQLGLEPTFAEYTDKLLAVIAEIKRVLKPSGQFWLNCGDLYVSNALSYRKIQEKSLLMMPERIALEMIDEGRWILRNKIAWAKQILDFKERKTEGSIMPRSVKDRFNESWEYLYFFVKNKKYWSDLDAVRLPNQVMGVTDMRDAGILRQRMYEGSKYNQDPTYKPTYKPTNFVDSGLMYKNSKYRNEKYRGKFAGNPNAEMFNSPRTRTQRNWKQEEAEGYKMGSVDPHREALRGGPKNLRQQKAKEQGMHTFYSHSRRNKVNDPCKAIRKKGEAIKGIFMGQINSQWDKSGAMYNPLRKNLPTVWLIQSEPHNFQKELGPEITQDHFATFPQALVEIPIRFGCPPKGIVLDPFMGSGTTAIVAKKLGRNYLGIELNPKYIEIAEKRLRQTPSPII